MLQIVMYREESRYAFVSMDVIVKHPLSVRHQLSRQSDVEDTELLPGTKSNVTAASPSEDSQPGSPAPDSWRGRAVSCPRRSSSRA
jgi:hypothetical protein